ncbi:MAG: hypothetical protein JRN20_15475 [Nitrososphaerota archaeon]|nr:hypothetical protein [Nitrososphaerota archaeon]
MQYTLRAFIEGRDERLGEICRVFPSMERTAYSMRREGKKATEMKFILRERYGIKNARWNQSALNQANATVKSQEEGIKYKIELYKEKIRNTSEKINHLSNELKIAGCKTKITKFEKKAEKLREQLDDKSYPQAVFGSKKLYHQLSIASETRKKELKEEWKGKRSNHFFSVGQANQKGNANTRIISDDDFYLEIRNWFEEDFRIPLNVPEYAKDILKQVVRTAESVKLLEEGSKGLAYSVRVIKSTQGYQVFISFEPEAPLVKWSGRLSGVDINPDGIACTIVSRDGNLIATRLFKENRLISASKNKRKWVLESLINRMLNWCLCNYNCNALSVEELKFKGAYDRDSKTNYKLSNFMKKKMIEVIKLHALRKSMVVLEVNPAYTSMVAIAKYGMQFGGFNRHQLAAFVIGRRALGYKESPTGICLVKTRKEKKMWRYCSKNYGYKSQLQTLLLHEPMEWKSAWADNGEGTVTELLNKARPASTSETEKGLRSHINAPADDRAGYVSVIAPTGRQAGSVHPNRHISEGDGATEHRVDSAPEGVDNLLYSGNDMEDTVIW